MAEDEHKSKTATVSQQFYDGRVFNYFRRIRSAISFAAFPWRSYNRICNILENISGVGIRIEKQSKENPNWILAVDPVEIEGYKGEKTVVTGTDTTTDSSTGTTTVWLTTETWTYDAGLLKSVEPGQKIELFKFKVCE